MRERSSVPVPQRLSSLQSVSGSSSVSSDCTMSGPRCSTQSSHSAAAPPIRGHTSCEISCRICADGRITDWDCEQNKQLERARTRTWVWWVWMRPRALVRRSLQPAHTSLSFEPDPDAAEVEFLLQKRRKLGVCLRNKCRHELLLWYNKSVKR